MPNITAMEPKPAMPVLAKPKPIINEAYLTVPAAELLVAPDPATADPTSAYPPTPGAAPKLLKPGPVAIFISKKEGKLFVRKGFEPVFDVPIKIENPDIPLGTHVYTATQAKEGSLGMDWIALSLPPEARVASRTDKRSRTRGAKHQIAAPPVPPVGPSKPLHVGHRCVLIEIRVVNAVLLNDAEDPHRGRISPRAGRCWRLSNQRG